MALTGRFSILLLHAHPVVETDALADFPGRSCLKRAVCALVETKNPLSRSVDQRWSLTGSPKRPGGRYAAAIGSALRPT